MSHPLFWHRGCRVFLAKQAPAWSKENDIMNRIVTAFALALSLASASAVALADAGRAPAARHERGDQAEKAKKFPMPAAEFQQKATARATKARERMEKRLSEKQVPSEKANEIRAKFNETQAKVASKVTEVCADGTVTLDEAKAVGAVAHAGRPHKAHGKKGSKKLPVCLALQPREACVAALRERAPRRRVVLRVPAVPTAARGVLQGTAHARMPDGFPSPPAVARA